MRKRFEEHVRDFVFARHAVQESPVLVLLGGQPASGKSQATTVVEQRHADGQLVPLTGDELRPFQPQYKKLLAEHPQLFPNATGQASGTWGRMSIEHARDNGYSLLLEGAFRDPEMTVATAGSSPRLAVGWRSSAWACARSAAEKPGCRPQAVMAESAHGLPALRSGPMGR
ncbi:zeta toxin family protein [Streptomyces sp. NPDC048604]|uniref:zeta toxin family protein n=1 Tax=Streptomyces sp. NPDC048604 TaxID=3365578 RepID=UPI00371E7B28